MAATHKRGRQDEISLLGEISRNLYLKREISTTEEKSLLQREIHTSERKYDTRTCTQKLISKTGCHHTHAHHSGPGYTLTYSLSHSQRFTHIHTHPPTHTQPHINPHTPTNPHIHEHTHTHTVTHTHTINPRSVEILEI